MGKVINFPINRKLTRAEELGELAKSLPEECTVLLVWVDDDKNEYWWATQQGKSRLSTLLGILELIKPELIQSARRSENG
jgi:hypothetical protein